MRLTREQILAVCDRATAEVPVPEWGEGGVVRVQSMTGKERAAFELKYGVAAGDNGARPTPIEIMTRLVVATAVDEDGRPLFTVEDLDALAEKNAKIITRIFNASVKL